ncbi:M56 family metallopeptidase [Salinimonas marina]|uniref:M56 family metallopeptidase n=1 Tax=Salinimonas marina TaxID=2785918 RepID=UPI001E54B9FF|nr:M56 family metallopeptidase [Salinimonas marina]
MIEWLVQQQGPLCLALLLMIGLEHFFTPRLGARFTYGLWLLVPFTVLLNNLPRQIIAVPSNSFNRYVVGGSPSTELTESQVLLMIWAAGTIVLSLFFVLQYWQFKRAVEDGGDSHAGVCYSERTTTPVLFGFFAPKILLPDNFKALFCPQQQQLILEHEQTHIRQQDPLWNALALFIVVTFWFNPLVWLGMRSFRINQELACDSRVLSAKTETQKFLYAKALLQCAEHTSQPPLFTLHLEKKALCSND